MDTTRLSRVIESLEGMVNADEPPTEQELRELLIDLGWLKNDIEELEEALDDKDNEVDELQERIHELRSTRIRSKITLLPSLNGLDCSGCNNSCTSLNSQIPAYCPHCGGRAVNGGSVEKAHLRSKADYYRNYRQSQITRGSNSIYWQPWKG